MERKASKAVQIFNREKFSSEIIVVCVCSSCMFSVYLHEWKQIKLTKVFLNGQKKKINLKLTKRRKKKIKTCWH